MTQRTWWLLAVLAVVLIGALFYFFHDFGAGSPASNSPFNFQNPFATTTSSKGKPAVKQTAPAPSTTTRSNSGYTVTVFEKIETITSTAAGVSLNAPVNSVVSQTNGILSVRPPESTAGESLLIQKSTSGFADSLAQVRSTINGTPTGFSAVHNAEVNAEFNPGNVAQAAHIVKLQNVTVGGVAAVKLHITNSQTSDVAARDFYVIWVQQGSSNWYIVRTGAGLTPEAASALDVMTNSINLIR